MKKNKHLIDLPEVFVSFATEKLEGCRVVYLNETLAAGQDRSVILDRYSYIVNTGQSPRSDRSGVKEFMAERYGGDGIGRNGGGGRCGFDGVWQLKGLGPNALVDKDIDAANGDGNQCLATAIYESVWAEIVQAALPYGAVRTVAVLDTGLAYEKYGQPKTRGLIVREPAVRPAHFMRSIYFRQQRLDRLGEDAQRVQATIRKLAEFLPVANNVTTAASSHEHLESGLFELTRRYAEQFAAARAKHIAHYNVSASNISLDGAWLDVSGTRLFTHAFCFNRMSTERFNAEYSAAINSLQSLCYYLSKYSVVSQEVSDQLFTALMKHFAHHYARHFSLYEVAQTGFPLWVLASLTDSEAFSAFAQCLRTFLARDDFTVLTLGPEDGWEGHERWTRRMYSALLSAKINNAPFASPAGIEISDLQADQLCSSFNRLVDLAAGVADSQGIDLQNFYRCMAINAVRLNRSHPVLHNLQERIKSIKTHALEDQGTACQALAQEALHAARLHLGSEHGHTTPMWLSDTLSIEFEPASGLFTTHMADKCALSINELFESGHHHKGVQAALQFYREIWSILNEKSI